MKLSTLLPPPIRRFVRQRLTVFVYTYGFRPSPSITEQILSFSLGDQRFSVKASYRTALYDMIAEVLDYDCYQLKKLSWSPSGARCIVDIGANVGVTAMVLAQIPGAQVTCYEPDPENCSLLRENVARNGLQNITVRQAAVGATDGKLQFQAHTESTGGFLSSSSAGPGFKTLTVDAVTLQRVLEESSSGTIDLLKCDCEGGEYTLLDQLTPAMASRILNITMETHDLEGGRNIEWIRKKLSGLGYEISLLPDMWERSALHLLLARRAS